MTRERFTIHLNTVSDIYSAHSVQYLGGKYSNTHMNNVFFFL